MKERIILTDCDGCILDWEFGFHTWMESHGHTLKNKDVYKMVEAYDLSSKTASNLVRTFNESAAIGFLPPLRDAQYFIKKLHEQHRYQFICITSLSEDPHAQKLREKNLSKIFGPNTFKEVICLDCGADKDEALAKAAKKYPSAFWIEDKMTNVEEGINNGLRGILVEHGHNMNYKGDAFVGKTWEDIYNYIIEQDG